MTDSAQDERAILAALEALEDEPEPTPAAAVGPEDRSYRELWGLLPFALDPVTPAAHVKERVMAEIRALSAPSQPPAAPLPFRSPLTERPETAAAAPARRWLLPLAAAIAALAVGLGAWLHARDVAQTTEIAQLRAALELSERRVATLESSRGVLEEHLALAATPGMEVCPLAPMETSPLAARGVVFMDPNGGKWLLRATNLEPAPEGRVYTLWFLGSDGEAMRGGNLEPMQRDSYQLAAEGMPEAMTGIAVTLESDEAVAEPTGPTVLFGDERFSI